MTLVGFNKMYEFLFFFGLGQEKLKEKRERKNEEMMLIKTISIKSYFINIFSLLFAMLLLIHFPSPILKHHIHYMTQNSIFMSFLL
jgi:hypothetical protein